MWWQPVVSLMSYFNKDEEEVMPPDTYIAKIV